MFQLNLSNQAKKDIKRLDKPVVRKVLSVLEEIAEDPDAGQPLQGALSNLKKWNLNYKGTEFRIAYQIYEKHIEVRIIKIGTRENFYYELKRRI